MSTDRDRSIEALLRRGERSVSQATDQCVDAESLAAWMEGGLSRDTRAAVERHAAGCARCQALLASMARSAPDIEVPPWWRSFTAKWLVPVAAIATALVVWISVGREPVAPRIAQPPSIEVPRPASPPETSAATPAPASAEPDQSAPLGASTDKLSAPLERSRRMESETRQEVDRKLARRPDDNRFAAVAEPKRSAAPQPLAGGVAGGARDALRPQGQTMADSSARSVASPPPPPPVSTPVAGAPAPAPAAAPAPAPVNVAPAEAKPAPVGALAESVSVSRELAAKQSAAGRAGAASSIVGIEIQSPDPNYRWRILPPTAIQRSTDGGATWSIVDPLRAALRGDGGTTTVLTAGSSPSRDVCWIVGRAGTVLLSVNGGTWQRRPFPENVDLTGIRASSATNAVVTAADGRQWGTSDGAATWRVVK